MTAVAFDPYFSTCFGELRPRPASAKQLAGDAAAIELAVSPDGRPMDTSPFSASKTSNWVARAGGLPDYVRGVAHALLRKGRAADEAHAISMAVGLMQDWASGRTPNGKGHVHPAVQAAAAKALAQWEAMRADAHSHSNEGGDVIEMAGPRGYIHGWIKVGPGNASALKPGDMIKASHPVHGSVNGVVTHVTARGDVVAAISAGGHAIPGATFAKADITAYKPKTTMADARKHLGLANDGGAMIELGGVFSEALHPRVAAGSTGGGQFAKGASGGAKAGAAPMKAAKGSQRKPLARPQPNHPAPSGQQQARAQQLRAQAGKYREHAKDLRAQIHAMVAQIHSSVTAQKTAKAAAAKASTAAKTAAKHPGKVKKATSKPRKKAAAPHRHTTIAARSAHIGHMRAHVATLRSQANALDAAANKLDRQAAAL